MRGDRGTTVFAIEVPAGLATAAGGLQALIADYSVRLTRGVPHLVARRAKR